MAVPQIDKTRRLDAIFARLARELNQMIYRGVQLTPKRREQCNEIIDAGGQTNEHGLDACDGDRYGMHDTPLN